MKTASEVFKRDRYWREAKSDEQRQILEEWTSAQRRKEEVRSATPNLILGDN